MACEDYPCCGHEWGDCEGQLYGTDAEIQRRALLEMAREDADDEENYWDYDGEQEAYFEEFDEVESDFWDYVGE